ncbi:metallophosphatase [Myxococcota bacterium]|nr:metallophosphatase [Myxococcota bacterium]MBU1432626.1 metallophosphatase [Myxococcota bacterium]MBU1899511.1 metallophosphatase [Myxococcota bacterium]
MSLDRRDVLKLLGGAAALSATPALAAPAAAEVTILHTNDTHARLEPFEGGRYAGLGGIARRAALIRQIRAARPATLVVDAGDTFQGTPYFNQFGGVAELRTMSAAGYDVVTLGNHDFDAGVDALLRAMAYARFSFTNSNFIITRPELAARVQPEILRRVGGRWIGLFGLGVSFEGLVSPKHHLGLRYTDPLVAARRSVARLRAQGAEAIICLSHLGIEGYQGEPGDVHVADQVEGVDLIVGGHSHTFLEAPRRVKQTAIVQVGHSGTHLGQVTLRFTPQGVEVAGEALPVAERWA